MGLLVGLFVVALFAAAATVGLLTGSLAPYWPAISRAEAPGKFWTVIGLSTAVVGLNIVNLLAN
jgi:hypothetical protein